MSLGEYGLIIRGVGWWLVNFLERFRFEVRAELFRGCGTRKTGHARIGVMPSS